jgi:hypothetical protein
MRRMELERPATDAVVVRDIMEVVLLCFLVRPRRFGPGQRPWFWSARDSPRGGAER